MPSVTDIIAKLCAEQMRKLLEICLYGRLMVLRPSVKKQPNAGG